ncbi:serine hydrolase domain-containing protein [Georgenia sp. H159]|uniref:serine hydrolase domain-containing protein n=1 Tax=Georgenia sp. H159 TaxID=3076115 RepID=UPI002D7825B7|nr:serine hydrolase domain-containing protein [Georgenia sp. H159]
MSAFAELALPDFPHAVAVTDATGVRLTHGEATRSFRWASVTKLLTSTATLVAVSRHLVDLDDAAGPEGATVRHLLAHASGVALDSGDSLSAPGRRRIYSNHGIELVARHVEEATGTDFASWLEDTVLVPLGLSSVLLEGSPAHGAVGTVEDLAAFGRELLAPTVLDPHLVAEATSVQFPGLPGVLPGFGRQDPNDWGLAFEIRGQKSPHWTGSGNSPGTFGHFGQSGSFLWVDREAGLAAAFLGAERFGEWAAELWPRLSDAVLADLR